MLFAGSLWATCKHRTFFVPTYVEILPEEHISSFSREYLWRVTIICRSL